MNLEIAPHFLLQTVQVEDEVVFLLSIYLHWLPNLNLVDNGGFVFILDLVVVQALSPSRVVEDWFNSVLLHVGNDQIKFDEFCREWTQADRVEIDNLVPHIFEHAIEGQVVVLSQAELEEGHVLFHLFWLGLIAQLVVKEAAEELGVALLRVDSEGFAVFGALLIVVMNGFRMRLEHAEEDKERADHHACATLARLAVDHDDWLGWEIFALVINVKLVSCARIFFLLLELVILLHSLQKECCIHAKSEDFLQIGDIVVEEGELADGERFDRVL